MAISIDIKLSNRVFFVWDSIGPHIGWVWWGKAHEAARTYHDGWVFD